MSNINNVTSLATVSGSQVTPIVNGMVATRAPKSGALRLGVERKKQYRERMVKLVNPKTGVNFTNGEANTMYDQVRAAQLKQMNAHLGQKIASGEIQVESIGADPLGHLTTARFTKERQQTRDKRTRAAEDLAAASGLSVDEVNKAIARLSAERAKQAAEQPAIEVGGTEQPQESNAQPAQHVATA